MLVLKNPGRASKKEIERLFDLGKDTEGFGARGLFLKSPELPNPIMPGQVKTYSSHTPDNDLRARGFDRFGTLNRSIGAKSPRLEDYFPRGLADKGLSREESHSKHSVPSEEFVGASGDNLGEELYESALDEPLVFADQVEIKRDIDSQVEEIVKARWKYLVMQFGGVFMNEIRPGKCMVENKSLSDLLVKFDGKKYSLNLDLLGDYLKANSQGLVQVHFSDIMFDPRSKEHDIFSITSGDIKKARIFLELSEFLEKWNHGKETVIPVHLPYYEKWKTSQGVREFGRRDDNGKRDSIIRAEKVLRYLNEKWNSRSVKLALETGNGESMRGGEVNYALIYEPHHLKFLTRGRESLVSICEDVGHINLTDADWKDYLPERISEFHVSGNNGKEDLHMIATPETLKNYGEIISFLKFYTGNVCAEIGRGSLSAEEFVRGVKKLAYELFSEPDNQDFENLRRIEHHLKITDDKKINSGNLNHERYSRFK